MKRYLRVYIVLLRLNLEALIVYPANFYNGLIASVVWGAFSLYSIVLLTSQTKVVFGWTREEILLLNGVYGVLIGIFHTLFSRNFERFSSVIHQGQLDSVLIKPIDGQFLLSSWFFGWTNLSRVIIAVGYLVVLSHLFLLEFSFVHLILFIGLGLFAILTLYSIWYIVITLTIWFTRLSNLVELMFNITGVARYPRQMFAQSVGIAAWLLLPLLLIINVPAKIYLEKLDFIETIVMCGLSVGLFMVSRIFWKFALRYYGSASSW